MLAISCQHYNLCFTTVLCKSSIAIQIYSVSIYHSEDATFFRMDGWSFQGCLYPTTAILRLPIHPCKQTEYSSWHKTARETSQLCTDPKAVVTGLRNSRSSSVSFLCWPWATSADLCRCCYTWLSEKSVGEPERWTLPADARVGRDVCTHAYICITTKSDANWHGFINGKVWGHKWARRW